MESHKVDGARFAAPIPENIEVNDQSLHTYESAESHHVHPFHQDHLYSCSGMRGAGGVRLIQTRHRSPRLFQVVQIP